MALRIEKVWGAIFGQTAIKRKDSPDRDSLPRDKEREQPQDRREERRKPADRATVEKAVTDLRATSQFTQTGMSVEAFDAAGGLSVRLIRSNGSVVKTMSAEEFLRLRDASSADITPRGKILDQKF